MRRMFSCSRRARSITVGAVTAAAVLAASLTGCTSHSTAVDTSSAAAAAAAAESSASAAAAAAAAQAAAQSRAAALKAQADEAAAAKMAAAKAAAAKMAAAKAAAAKMGAAKMGAAKAAAAKAAAAKAAVKAARAAKVAAGMRAAKVAAAAKAAAVKAARAKALAAAAARIDPLTGGAISHNPVIAVKLDNTYMGRPQFGLDMADIVYDEQVEGGLTRLMAIFHTNLPTEVGPVRSVRSTDTQLLPSYGQPFLVFSGGAGGPLALLAESSSIVNTSGFAATWRSGAKPAPYNLHANLQQVAAAGPKKPVVNSPGFQFQTPYPAGFALHAGSQIDVQMGSGFTSFHWTKDGYRVYPAGNPGSAYDGAPLLTGNVLIQQVQDVPDGTVDTNGQPSLLSKTVGSGTVMLFRNGHSMTGTWSRDKAGDPMVYRDGHQLLKFAPGKTWVMLVPQNATYSWR